ncbi:MAG TPA: hypothetical protein VL651_14495 [Bacteroidia bacterium]|jgi:hypothetical protein|nr:hypothetical protein [Bacteroidia bacterium]
MKQLVRPLLFIAILLFSVQADARTYHPRTIKTKNLTGSGDGDGANDASVKLPIGFPFESTESSSSGTETSATKSNIVYTFDIQDDIGPTVLHQTRNALAEARDMNADYVLIHISSTAGAMDAAEDIKNEINNFGKPVLVYMDNKNIPASQLISAAGDSVYLRNITSAINAKDFNRKPVNTSIAAQRKAEKFNTVTLTTWDADPHSGMISRHPKSFFPLSEANSGVDAVLFHAGLSDLKVVEYKETFISKMVDMLLSPAAGFFLALLFSFIIALQKRSSFPGPVTFLMIIILPFVIYPLYTGGLAKMWELGLLLLMSSLLLLLRNRKEYVQQFLLLGLAFAFFLCRSGDFLLFVNSSAAWQFALSFFAVFTGGNLLHLSRWFIQRFRSGTNTSLNYQLHS